MDQRTMIYLGSTGAIAVVVMINAPAYGPLGTIMIFMAIFAIMMIFILNYADFVIFPVLTNIFGIKIVPAKGYYIPKTNNCVIKYVNGIYYATGYLTANVYSYIFTAENIDEAEEAKMSQGPDKWERIVMNVDFPFRFNMISMSEEVQKYRDELEGKRGTLEYQLSKEMSGSAPNQLTIQDIQKKMAIIDTRINRLGAGERPVDSIMYIETTAVGVSEKESIDALSNQLNHLQTLFNAFDIIITRIIGRELYYLFTYNYFLPDREGFLDTFSTQG